MTEFDDFCGRHTINFDSVDHDLTNHIVTMLEAGASYSYVLDLPDDAQVIQCVCYAFSMNQLSREQIATLLELREMRREFGTVQVQEIPFLNSQGSFTDEARAFLLLTLSPDSLNDFHSGLQSKPKSEQCYFSFNINPGSLNDPRVSALLQISENLKIMFKSPSRIIQRHDFPEAAPTDESDAKDSQKMTILSVGARDALLECRYGQHAKLLYPRVGVFSKEDIEHSMRNKGRYSAVSYPGITGETSFHQISANAFYLTLHDEVHRHLISSIPNRIYTALIAAIDVVRHKIAVSNPSAPQHIWSKEIWDTIDMEVGDFLSFDPSRRDSNDQKTISRDFIYLLSALIYTEGRTAGLFTGSPYIDTTWLLLIDMAENTSQWQQYGIHPSLFPSNSLYLEMYNFIKSHYESIRDEPSPAKQVAILKSLYFDLPYSRDLDTVFKKNKQNLFQVVVDGKPIKLDKSTFLSLQNMEKIPEDSKDLINLILQDDREFRRHVRNQHDLDQLVKKLPSASDLIISKAFADKATRANIIVSAFDCIALSESFPGYLDKIITPIINDDIEFHRLINIYLDICILAKLFPLHSDAILTKLLYDDMICERILTSQESLIYLAHAFPEHVPLLIAKVRNNEILMGCIAARSTDSFVLENLVSLPDQASKSRQCVTGVAKKRISELRETNSEEVTPPSSTQSR